MRKIKRIRTVISFREISQSGNYQMDAASWTIFNHGNSIARLDNSYNLNPGTGTGTDNQQLITMALLTSPGVEIKTGQSLKVDFINFNVVGTVYGQINKLGVIETNYIVEYE